MPIPVHMRDSQALRLSVNAVARSSSLEVVAEESPRQVLIVDDEQAVRSVLRRYLSRRGWGVVEAANAEQALALIAEGTVVIDAVIVDLHMPGLGGAGLCQRIATVRPALSSRMILASGDAEAASEALKEKKMVCPVLAKPFELDELERALGNMLAH